jgi:hypothetical protein
MAQFQRTRTLKDTKAKGGGRDKAPQIRDIVELHDRNKANGKWVPIRLVGPMFSYAQHWIEINKEAGGTAKFPKQCLAYNDETETLDSTITCPYCELTGEDPGIQYYQNVIDRRVQEREPDDLRVSKAEKKTGFKEKDADSWTPMRVLELPPSAVKNLRDLGELNKHGKKGAKEAYDLSDEQFGCDVNYMFDKDAKGGDKHKFQKDEHTPLEDNELAYLMWNIEGMVKPDSEKDATKECERLEEKLVREDGDDDDDEPKYSKKGGKGKGKPADDDDEDDEPPKKKKAKVDDDDDDDEPPKRKKAKVDDDDDEPAPKKKAKPVDDDDDDEPPKRKKAKVDDDDDDEPAPKKKKAAEPDDDDYEPEVGDKVTVTDRDGDDVTGEVTKVNAKTIIIDDSDDESFTFSRKEVTVVKAVSKKKPAPKKVEEDDDEPAPKKKAKPVDDDDDEPAPKKKAKKVDDDDDDDEPAPKKKRPSFDDDED